MKTCEKCGVEIPDDFGNALCLQCYANIAKPSVFGISDPDYQENPEQDDKQQILANLAQFVYTSVKDPRRGKLLWYPQRGMYTYVRNYLLERARNHPQFPKDVWKLDVADVGCGSGVGSNVMSQEANFVWGIDKNELSIQFAKEAFTREKNGFYYSGQLTFDVFDVMVDNREVMKFDVVTAIEIIEHIYDSNAFLNALKRFAKKDKQGNFHCQTPTDFFISTPNRNFVKIRKDHPENPFHIREWRAQEFHWLLGQHFEEVSFMNWKGEAITKDDEVNEVIFARCRFPK